MKSEQINELAKALVQVQRVLRGAKKDSQNPFFKSTYANLESVWDAARQPLTDNGLCVVQTFGDSNLGPTLVTTLIHESGQWISGSQPLMAKTQDPQGLGSAASYSRRYGLAAILGIIQTDDDAESYHRPTQAKQQAKTVQAQISNDQYAIQVYDSKFSQGPALAAQQRPKSAITQQTTYPTKVTQPLPSSGPTMGIKK